MTDYDRRDFILDVSRGGIAYAAASTCRGAKAEAASEVEETHATFCAFTESFQDWSIPTVCQRFKELGLDGLDLTVRPGGHIEPKNARRQLPVAAQAATDMGLKISMLTTSILEPDQHADAILSTAGRLGIERVKLGYYLYEGFGNLQQQIDRVRHQIEGVATLAKKFEVLPCVHVHSGKIIPSGGPVAYLLLKEFAPDEVGAYVDPMHMTLEGGIDGWRQGLDLLAPWIAISSLKNAIWTDVGRDATGQRRWEPRKCPLADGIAPIPEYLATLKQIGYPGIFTLHSEYKDSNSWKQLSTEECLTQTKADLSYVRQHMRA